VAVAGGFGHNLGLRDTTSTGIEESDPGDVVGGQTLSILSLAPNPFNPSTEVAFEALAPGHVTIDVYDVSGRRVRTMPLGYMETGLHHARWDGRDARGHNVSSGVYFIRPLGADGASRTVKAVLIR
jgi:hypothetical protein